MDLKDICNELERLTMKKYFDKIGEIGTEDYNKDLDNICCDLLDLKAKIGY